MKIILDVETTGLYPYKGDEILELAICDLNKNILFHERFKPKIKKEWKYAEKIHNISPENVRDKFGIEFFKDEIWDILSVADEIIGYNVEFDINFLLAAFGKEETDRNMLPKSYDVMKEFAPFYWEDKNGNRKYPKLVEAARLCKYDWDEEKDAHGALADVLATIHVYNYIAENLIKF